MADDPWADDPNDRYGGDAPDAADGPHADLGTYASDRDVEAPNPKKGMGTGVKVLVGLLIGGFLLCAVCCGGFFWEISASGFGADATPAGVRAKADEIFTIDLPQDYQPQIGIGGSLPFSRWVADVRMDMAAYRTPGGGQLQIEKLSFPPEMAGPAERNQMEMQLRPLTEQSNPGGVLFTAAGAAEIRPLTTADGRSVNWTFAEGAAVTRDGTDLGEARQVTGKFEDGSDSYALNLVLTLENYDEDAVVAMLESIELVDPQTEPVPPGNDVPMEEAGVDVTPAGDDSDADIELDADADAAVEMDAEAP